MESVKCINLLTSDSLKIYNVKRQIKFEIKVHLIPRSLAIAGWKLKAVLYRIQKLRPADTQCLRGLTDHCAWWLQTISSGQ